MQAQPEDCSPSRRAFERFLAWLDEGADSSGEKYLEMRRRLVSYFQRKACAQSDDMADETLNRVARRLEEENTIQHAAPAHYCYAIARFVFLEHVRGAERRQLSFDKLANSDRILASTATPDALSHANEMKERLDLCLDRCSQNLTQEHRDLISSYYHGDRQAKIRHRRELAARIGITANALTIKACRIRAVLEACVRKCSADE